MAGFHTTTINIDLPEGSLEDIEAVFNVDVQTFPAEPYSWGESRGMETETSAEIFTVRLGDLLLDRGAMVKMLSEAAVGAIEDAAADEFIKIEAEN